MKTGDVFCSTSVTILETNPGSSLVRETWRCKKGYRYVLLLLGVEGKEMPPIDPEKALASMGFKRKKKKK